MEYLVALIVAVLLGLFYGLIIADSGVLYPLNWIFRKMGVQGSGDPADQVVGKIGSIKERFVLSTASSVSGKVFLEGTFWYATSSDISLVECNEGETVVVIGLENLTLRVRRRDN